MSIEIDILRLFIDSFISKLKIYAANEVIF